MTVTGAGSLAFDFGSECAGWLEFWSSDLAAVLAEGSVAVLMSISEHQDPQFTTPTSGNNGGNCTAPVQDIGSGLYRLVLNSELYEGLRYGWLHVQVGNQAASPHASAVKFTVRNVSAVCQVLPINYVDHAFEATGPSPVPGDEPGAGAAALQQVWYTAMYTTRVDLLPQGFGSILMDRGDRISWTGDAHLAQKAALAGFGGDFGTALVLNNTIRTQGVDNGIISYDLYFILSACDYFMHSGDTAALAGWAHLIEKKLQTSTSFWAKPVHQSFCGSDDRIGADFETSPPSESEKARYYKMLSVQAVNEYARATELCGAACPQAMHSNSQALAAAFAANFAREAPQLNQTYGMHSAAGAVLTGLTTPAEEQQIFDGLLANPAHVCSFAPFSTYFVLDAMGKLRLSGGRLQAMRAALAMVRRCYHGMNRLGATTYWETFSPEWLALFRPGEPTPNSQTGYMSHCHPWASGVAPWLSRSVLGLTPLAPGWSNFSVNPFLDPKAPNLLASVRGVQPLPRKRFIEAWFSCNGTGFLSVPASTTAGVVAIPLCDALPSSANLTINGKAVAAQPGDGCLIVRNLGPGRYAFAWQAARSHSRVAGDRASHLTTATSTTRPVYRDRFVRADNTTAGAWQSAGYGSAGHVFWSWRGASQDNTQLPPFVAGVDVQCHFTGVNARESKPNWVSPDSAPCSSDRRALQAPTTLVALPSLATALPKSSAPAAGCAGLGAYTCGAVATIDIMPAPGATQPTALNITLYLADWEGHGRKVAVELREYDNLQLAARTQLVRNFAEGVYLTWEVQSLPVRLRLMQVAQGLPYNNLMLAFSAVLFG